jgi:amino acid transporter
MGIVAGGAIVATTSVLLVFQMGQPRILMVMARDGLLPKRFSRVHPRFRTPGFATLVTGVFVAVPCLFTNLSEMTELTSIGTLFAFVLVCAGILLQNANAGPDYQPRFRVPFINGEWILPIGYVAAWVLLLFFNPAGLNAFFSPGSHPEGFWVGLGERLPMWAFILTATIVSLAARRYKLSLIPCLGLLTCLYLMAEIPALSWLRFGLWLLLGLLIYFAYGKQRSLLRDGSIN